ARRLQAVARAEVEEILGQVAKQRFRIGRDVEGSGERAYQEGALAEVLELEPGAIELRRSVEKRAACGRVELDDARHEEPLARRPRSGHERATLAKPLEANPLGRRVLIDEDQRSRRLADDVALESLADDAKSGEARRRVALSQVGVRRVALSVVPGRSLRPS